MDREREIKAEHKKKKRIVMEKGTMVQGVITVEMAYIIPIIFILFATIVYTVFFYHDKNILIGAAGETTEEDTEETETEAEETADGDAEE